MTSSLNGFLEYLAQQRRLSPRSIETYGYATGTYLAHLREHGLKPNQADPATVRASTRTSRSRAHS